MIINVAEDFYHRLANRNQTQGDGKFTAVQFRQRFLGHLDFHKSWDKKGPIVLFDFEGVKKLSPGFANEAFAHFTIYASPDKIFERIQFINISPVKRETIEREVQDSYYGVEL